MLCLIFANILMNGMNMFWEVLKTIKISICHLLCFGCGGCMCVCVYMHAGSLNYICQYSSIPLKYMILSMFL